MRACVCHLLGFKWVLCGRSAGYSLNVRSIAHSLALCSLQCTVVLIEPMQHLVSGAPECNIPSHFPSGLETELKD